MQLDTQEKRKYKGTKFTWNLYMYMYIFAFQTKCWRSLETKFAEKSGSEWDAKVHMEFEIKEKREADENSKRIWK